MEFVKDVLHGKIRGSTVNNSMGWGLQVLNDKKKMSLTTDLDLVHTEYIFACQWIQTVKDTVESEQ